MSAACEATSDLLARCAVLAPTQWHPHLPACLLCCLIVLQQPLAMHTVPHLAATSHCCGSILPRSDAARAVLVSMVKQLGPDYLPFVCEVLQSGEPTKASSCVLPDDQGTCWGCCVMVWFSCSWYPSTQHPTLLPTPSRSLPAQGLHRPCAGLHRACGD